MHRSRFVLLAVIASLAIPFLASGNHAYVDDGNDTPGLLDVRRVKMRYTEKPMWNVITYAGWNLPEMWDAGYVLVRIDTFGSTRFDYYALLRSNGNSMRGTLVRDRERKEDFNVSRIKAWHPTARSVRVRFPLRKMKIGKSRVQYRWRVETLFSSDRCPRICIDDAPNTGAVSEPIPGREQPTPLPSVTITPTPTPTE